MSKFTLLASQGMPFVRQQAVPSANGHCLLHMVYDADPRANGVGSLYRLETFAIYSSLQSIKTPDPFNGSQAVAHKINQSFSGLMRMLRYRITLPGSCACRAIVPLESSRPGVCSK